ncbi:MAG: biotin--[acetyl-CoA-carboxylase] ligase [Actinomycetota bacterium]
MSRAPQVGLWGTFDVDNYGDLVLAHISKVELERRLPGGSIRTYAPFGWFHPVGFQGVEPAEPLGVWSEERATQMASELDCVVVGGGDIIHTEADVLAHAYGIDPDEMRRLNPGAFFIEGLGPDLERECPVLWNAVGVPFDFTAEEAARVRSAAHPRRYLSVRDDESRSRLEAAGVESEVAVVPDPAVLLPRIFPPTQLEQALTFLRLMDWFPSRGPAVAVQGNGRLVSWVPALADAVRSMLERRDLSVVTIEIGPCHGDGEFAHVLHGALKGEVALYHVPGTARLEHVAAAIYGSAVFVGSSLHGSITAFAYGRPNVMLHGHGLSKMDSFAALSGGADRVVRAPERLPEVLGWAEAPSGGPDALPELQAQVDAHFDRVARIAQEAAGRERIRDPVGPHLADVRTLGAVLLQALTTRERRLAAERDSIAARLARSESALAAMAATIAPRDETLGEATSEPRRLRASLGTSTRRKRRFPRLRARAARGALDERGLERAVRRAGINAPPRYLDETASTNTEALALAERGAPEWTIVAAGHQTAGRGRLGRRWADAPGRSLLCSVVLRPRLTPDEAHLLTLAAAVSLIEAAGLPSLRSKWPNDLVVGDRKCAGILAEAEVEGGRLRHAVLGVGVNVSAGEDDFPEELRGRVTSLALEGLALDQEALLAGFLEALRRRIEARGFPAGVVDAYRSLCITLGRQVRATTASGAEVEGRAIDLDDRGGLLVERDGRAETVTFGEVQHLR